MAKAKTRTAKTRTAKTRDEDNQLETGINYDLQGDPTRGRERLKDIVMASGWHKSRQTASVMDLALTYQIRKLPTGIFSLDWFTHGGLPLDRVTRFYGPKNSCKTTTMLKVLANSQHYCRMCKTPLVVSPEDGRVNCECPQPRFRIKDAAALQYMPVDEALAITRGELPSSAESDKGGYFIRVQSKKVYFEETYRCVPMQAAFIETEHKLDKAWVQRNGVDTRLMVVVGAEWAESTIDTVESLLYSREVDIIFIDTLNLLVPRERIEKGMDMAPRVAVKANIIQRFLEKIIAAQYSGGLMNDHPITIIAASQVRTKGIGGYRTYLGASDGNMMDHVAALDIRMRSGGYHWIHQEYASYGSYQFTIDKNHVGGSSGVSGTFKMWLDPYVSTRQVGDTDDPDQVIKYGRQSGLIDEEKGYRIKSPYLSKGKRFRTLGALESFLVENPTVYRDLRRRVLEYMMSVRTEKKKKNENDE